VQQMGTRLASGGGTLAALVRQSQDLAALWRDKDEALITALAEGKNQVGIDALRKEIADIESDKDEALITALSEGNIRLALTSCARR
jgi:hypothetical protein